MYGTPFSKLSLYKRSGVDHAPKRGWGGCRNSEVSRAVGSCGYLVLVLKTKLTTTTVTMTKIFFSKNNLFEVDSAITK